MSEQPLRVVLVDDDEDYFVIVRDLLSEIQGLRTELAWLDSYEKGLTAIVQNHTDVFIVDYRLGARNGLDLLNQAVAHKIPTPFILLTGQGDQEIAVEAMKAGAVDYLIKGQVDAPLLERSLRHALESSQNRQLVRRMIEILETTHDLIGSCDTEGFLTYLNAAGRRMLGVGAEEPLSGLSIKQFHPPGLSTQILNDAFPIANREGSWSGETVLLSRDGREVPVLAAIVAHKTIDGQIMYYSATAHDITERKQAEEQLRLQGMALESAANGIVITDAEGTIRWVNPSFTKLTGYAGAEAIGKNPRFLNSGQHSRDFYAALWEAIKAGYVWRGEIVNRRKDGSLYNEEMTITPVQNGDGQTTQFIAIKQDITERKKAEELLQQTNKRLRDALDELQTAEEKVIQQERLRALGTMASGIAHDFNNALAAILGFSELLIHRPENLNDKERALRFLKILNTTARDAGNVVNRLREFYRHREESDMCAPIELNEIVRESVSLTQPRWMNEAQAKGVNIEVRTELQDIPTIPGNEPELREALANLILNAVDAMPHGGTIVLRTRWEDNHVQLEVTDTGTGMTEEVRRRCLEPFFSTKGKRGTGLGLSMVYGTVRRHEGRIDIRSELGKGTTFVVQLPVQPTRANGDGAKKENAVTLPVRPLRVLIVDDEPVVREVIAEYLKTDGHTVEAAGSGPDGLERFGQGNFDLVLLDRAMPGMNGDQVANGMKSADPKVPIVMLTGFGSMMIAADEKPPDVDFVIGKPVTMSALREAIAKAIQPAH